MNEKRAFNFIAAKKCVLCGLRSLPRTGLRGIQPYAI